MVIVIAFPTLYYLTGSAPEHKVPFTIIMVLGVMLVGITVKIVAKLDANTRDILRAIAELPQK